MPHFSRPPLVLLVEDLPELREVYAEILTSEGLQETACDGVEGVEKAIALQPDVIVMDVQLPRMNGLAAIRRLKADPRTRSIPVIVSTCEPVEQQAREAECDFLAKPCSMDALVSAVRRLLPV